MSNNILSRRDWLKVTSTMSLATGAAAIVPKVMGDDRRGQATDRSSTLLDHRWVVEEQQVILQPEDVGLNQPKIFQPEGLTRAKSGDLLLAACCQEAAKTFIMRSTDQGHTWTRQGVLKNKGGGSSEGMVALRSRRLVMICYRPDGKAAKIPFGSEYHVPGASNFRFEYLRSEQYGAYSDDEGMTWHYTPPMDIAPFQAASFVSSSQIFETDDGTLVTSFYGHLNDKQVEAGVGSVGLIRSHDGGNTWGDVSVICSGQPGSGDWYNESYVTPLPDGRWLCMVRMNPNHEHRKMPLYMKRCYSRDAGRTWTHPVPTRFRGGEPGGTVLPDGGVLCSQTAGWTIDLEIREDRINALRYGILDRGKLLYEVSYNGGLTWDYWGDLYRAERESKQHIGSTIVRVLDDQHLLAVYHCGTKALGERHGHRARVIGATWLQRVSAESSKAKGLTNT